MGILKPEKEQGCKSTGGENGSKCGNLKKKLQQKKYDKGARCRGSWVRLHADFLSVNVKESDG